MINKRMPTTRILVALSWVIALLGILQGLYVIFIFRTAAHTLSGFKIILGYMVLAAAVRMLSIIGQFVFEMFETVTQINCDTRDITQGIHEIKTFFERIEKHLDLKK